MKKFTIIAGPCVVESNEMLHEVCAHVAPICAELGFDYVFKSSYRKANRTSGSSFVGIGDELALGYLAGIRTEFGVPVLTDVHTAEEAIAAAAYVDVLQIPAFLCRQTDILQAAGSTGRGAEGKGRAAAQSRGGEELAMPAVPGTEASHKSRNRG